MIYRIQITPELVAGWVKTGAEIGPVRCIEGLPSDAEVRTVSLDAHRRVIVLELETTEPGKARDFNPVYQRVE